MRKYRVESMKDLASEIESILRRSYASDENVSEDVDPEDFLEEGDCDSCWHLQEAAQFLAEEMAERTGLSEEFLSKVLLEAMSCDSDCKKQYVTSKGDFKGGKGQAFDSCVEYAKDCCSGVKDPAAFCAYIGRKANKI